MALRPVDQSPNAPKVAPEWYRHTIVVELEQLRVQVAVSNAYAMSRGLRLTGYRRGLYPVRVLQGISRHPSSFAPTFRSYCRTCPVCPEPAANAATQETTMEFELQARSDTGREMVAQAEDFAARFAPAAAANDRDSAFPHDHLDVLKEAGYLYAPIPRRFGGMGVRLVHDIFTASSRLARGDASLTIGVNMHFVTLMSLARQYRIFCAAGREDRAADVARRMRHIVSDRVVIAGLTSEPDQDLTSPRTVAVREGAGWRVTGKKIFGTLSPGATELVVAVRQGNGGDDRYAFAWVPCNAPGVTLNDDWDALGMRASGSGSVTFQDVYIDADAMGGGFPVGALPGYLERYLPTGAGFASASLGIAEEAGRIALDASASRRRRRGLTSERPTTQVLAAENLVELAALRALFERATDVVDEYYACNPTSAGGVEALYPVFGQVQAAKSFAAAASVRIVDRAMTIAGGGAYMSGHPLSRLYRDARAAGFMHPLGANVAPEFLGALALGLEPETL